MSLADLIRGTRRGATATPATPATVHVPGPPSVATVATVAVATPTVAEIETMALSSFGRSDLVLHVDSAVLGEQVLFVSDGYRPAPGDPAAYRADELDVLLGAPAELVRLVHGVKRTFPGARVAGRSREERSA